MIITNKRGIFAAAGTRIPVTVRGAGSTSSALATICLALQAGGCGRPALYCGNTVTTGKQDTLMVAVVERGRGIFAERLQGIEVSFYADGQEVGRARTDKVGYAVATGRIPLGVRTLEARSSPGGQSLKAQGEVLTWDHDQTIVICDIDGTISDTNNETLAFGTQDTGSNVYPGAAEALQKISKHYNILFLTGRPVYVRDKTYEWLAEHGFPPSAAILAPNLHDALEVMQFKLAVMERIKRLYPNVLIGIGNAETDSQAYSDAGMLAIMIDDGKNRRFRSEAIALRTWSRVGEFFIANKDCLSDPSKLRVLVGFQIGKHVIMGAWQRKRPSERSDGCPSRTYRRRP